jgi:copper(I)-binding protein
MVLRNVHLQAVQHSDYIQPGQDVELVLVAVNNSSDTNDKLVGITSDVGSVTLTGNTNIPAGSSLLIGSADGNDAVMAMGTAERARATVTLSKPISNGLNYDFTFDFEKAGKTTVAVPISAGNAPREEQASVQHG